MDDEYLLYEVEMKPGKGVLLVTQNLPVEMSRLQVLSDFISNEMVWDYIVLCLGRTLPSGDVEIWLHPDVPQHGNELNFSNGLILNMTQHLPTFSGEPHAVQEQKKKAEAAMSRRLEARKQSSNPKQATLRFVAPGLAASSSSQ